MKWKLYIDFTGVRLELHMTGEYNWVCGQAKRIAEILGGYFNYDIEAE